MYQLIPLIFFFLLSTCSTDSDKKAGGEDNTGGEKLVWSDEFDYEGLPDSKKWTHETGGHGWGNNELQYYTDGRTQNARVANGSLFITARLEDYEGSAYTSARLVSKAKGDWLYGRIEVRAKLPKGKGTWPAVWMLPTDWAYGGWPTSGEIDIMEHVGYDQGWVHASVHTESYNHVIGTQKTAKVYKNDVSEEFHIYSMEWNADTVSVAMDGTTYFTFVNPKMTFREWPFDKRFHLLLNIAVGGNWGGAQGVDPNVFPQTMEVDYVRVYQ